MRKIKNEPAAVAGEKRGGSSPATLLERKGIYLTIDYQRISPNDKTGMVDITCEGDESWVYADIGSHHGAQCSDTAIEKKVMSFGAKVSALVKEHFGMVRPILDDNPGDKKQKRSNDQAHGCRT